MNLFERLKEERERLGYNQTAFAALADASKHAQINWEKGVASPNATALAVWAAVGMDVLYVVTGQRSQALPAEALLPQDERILLDNFRHAPAAVQSGIKTTLGAFAPGGSSKRSKRAA